MMVMFWCCFLKPVRERCWHMYEDAVTTGSTEQWGTFDAAWSFINILKHKTKATLENNSKEKAYFNISKQPICSKYVLSFKNNIIKTDKTWKR